MTEHRHFHRIKFVVQADFELNGTSLPTSLVDISLKGALVALPAGTSAALGSPCRLTLHLSSADVQLPFTGEIIHINDGLAGIKFTRIDIDTMIHLRRLLELNSANPEQIRRELHELIHS